jgi:drug/metabolite transporter (DMT)-like permease
LRNSVTSSERCHNGMSRQSTVLAFILTLSALVAFAGNSVLCRLALGARVIDAYSFTAVRLGSGALALTLLNTLRQPLRGPTNGSWQGALFLVLYALPFSLAYVQLDAGTGALLLFAAVQLTMIGSGLRSGERLLALEWLGFLGAIGGIVYLVFPGLTAPNPIGATMMIAAGISWGGYSIIGKTAGDPGSVTAGNFQRAALLVVPVAVLGWPWLSLSFRGVLLATASGVLASGLGYTAWYAALKYLSVTRAALVQLSVPLIAAVGGVTFLGETITIRLISASVVILGSVVLAISIRHPKPGAETGT